MLPMDLAWRLLKRQPGQPELGEFHPDLPSSQGPIVAYHGKGVNEDRRRQFQTEGILPVDTPEAQVGSGRYVQRQQGNDAYWNRDIPANVSVTGNLSTAEEFATHGTRVDGNPLQGRPDSEEVVYGVRAGALANQLPMDDPRRLSAQHFPEVGREGGGAKTHRFIAGGIAPEALHAFSGRDAQKHAGGHWARNLGQFQTHGPDKVYWDTLAEYEKENPRPQREFENKDEHFTSSRRFVDNPAYEKWSDAQGRAAFSGREQWIDDQVSNWQAQQAQQAQLQQQLQQRQQQQQSMMNPDPSGQTTLNTFQTGEPMDLAWRLLKVDDEIPDFSDEPVDQCEMCNKYLHDSDYHVLNDHNFCSDCYNQLAEEGM